MEIRCESQGGEKVMSGDPGETRSQTQRNYIERHYHGVSY